ncbi:hypothetical protein K438DRAFT_1992067 [Mycena galopus ATCC 62051]|nr:hypothetical protein K438DRAFT_1992067 [Mycena galopus ATCC 62051]
MASTDETYTRDKDPDAKLNYATVKQRKHIIMSLASFQPLTISIVGAGIGGLTAAIALRRNGHNVQIFEAAQNKAEIVANLTVQTNALRVLDHLGVSRDNLKGLPIRGNMLFSSNGGEGITYPWLVPGMDENGVICHRSNLHEELRRLAMGEGEGTPAQLRLGTKVLACDVEEGTVTLDGGKVVHADFILGADGIHSVTRAQMLGSVGKLEWLYTGVFSESAIRWVVKERPFRVLFVYPRLGSLLNVTGFYADSKDDPGSLDSDCNSGGIRRQIPRLRSQIPACLGSSHAQPDPQMDATSTSLLSTWVLGRAALLGDAAHATLPFLGQGAGMGIEEAGALGCLLPAGTRREDVPARLRAYECLRKQRGDFVKTESIEQVSKFFTFLGSGEIQRYLLTYDAVKAGRSATKRLWVGGSLAKPETYLTP